MFKHIIMFLTAISIISISSTSVNATSSSGSIGSKTVASSSSQSEDSSQNNTREKLIKEITDSSSSDDNSTDDSSSQIDYYNDPYYDTDGNATLVDSKKIIYNSDEMQFISVTTKDGHIFYVLINYTDDDNIDNVYFLNNVRNTYGHYKLLE